MRKQIHAINEVKMNIKLMKDLKEGDRIIVLSDANTGEVYEKNPKIDQLLQKKIFKIIDSGAISMPYVHWAKGTLFEVTENDGDMCWGNFMKGSKVLHSDGLLLEGTFEEWIKEKKIIVERLIKKDYIKGVNW